MARGPIDSIRLARLRAASQAHHRPHALRDPVDVVRAAGPVQAQEQRAARLAFRARSRRLTSADIDRARTEERSLLRAWVMRKTAHLLATEDAGWLLPLFAERIVPWSRERLADLGFGAEAQERALALIHASVDRDGPLTRPELVERLVRGGFAKAASEAKYHLWTLATLAGDLCLGPDRAGLTCLVRTEEWIGPLERRPRDDSLAELARRFVGAYGPADERDLARWAGLRIGDARLGFERIAGELVEIGTADGVLHCHRVVPRAAPGPVVRLLGAYDNYNLGYVSRRFAVDPDGERRINPGGGIVRPSLTVDGRPIATWSSKRTGKRLLLTLEPFRPLTGELDDAIAAEVADIGRFEDCEAKLA